MKETTSLEQLEGE